MTTNLDHLWRFPLRRGSSTDPIDGACLLDAVSWFEYGHLGDHPPCTCPVQAAYGRVTNDSFDDARRQVLRGYVTRLVGTVDPPNEILRAEYAVRRTVREVLPIVLESRGFCDQARRCVELPPDATMEECRVVASAAAAGVAADYAAAAAAYAAHAADAAAHAAVADAAAHAAVAAADAARATAAVAAADAIYDVVLSIFDGMLRIGRQADPILPALIVAVNDSFAEASRTRPAISLPVA